MCKLYGCKSEENADFNILFAIFNCCINEGSGNFDAKIHGIDSNGHVLVTLNYYNRKSSVNYQMLLSEGIIPENHIYYEDYLDLKI